MKLAVYHNSNYAAKAVTLKNLRKHPNADRLQLADVDGQTIITGLDAVEGALYVHFPLECVLAPELLRMSNAYSDKEMNIDPSKKGLFGRQGRVKAAKLRGVVSEGYLHPIADVAEWLRLNGWEGFKIEEGEVFDGLSPDVRLCWKYEPHKNAAPEGNGRKIKPGQAAASRLIPGQFALHADTANMARSMHVLTPSSIIHISRKIHGTNATFSRALTTRKLSWLERVLLMLGARLRTTERTVVWASRNVIKNGRADGYYKRDVWAEAVAKIGPLLSDGVSLYCEIAGDEIQKGYDYGAPMGEFGVWAFRGTITMEDGAVYEMTSRQLEEYCSERGIATAPTLFYGRADALHPVGESESMEQWRAGLLDHMKRLYLGRPCSICRNTVPDEGVVLRLETLHGYRAYKLKSPEFLLRETTELDAGRGDLSENPQI